MKFFIENLKIAEIHFLILKINGENFIKSTFTYKFFRSSYLFVIKELL